VSAAAAESTGLPGAHAHRVIFIDLARALAVFFMLYGHTIDALLEPGYRAGVWFDAWQFQRGLTSSLFLLLSGFAFSIATGRHWSSHVRITPAWWRRVRRFAWFVFLGYSLHSPVGRAVDYKYATAEGWRTFFAVDVLQLIGVTFIGVQCLVFVTRTRARFTKVAIALAVVLVAIAPAVWAVDWSRWLPMWAWGYLSPVLGPSFPLFPAVPWSAFILIGAALGQIYSSWGGSHLEEFANKVLLIPGTIAVALGYGVAFLPIVAFENGARSVLPVDLLIRTGACMVIMGAIAHASQRVVRLPHVFSAVAQETLVIYFFHLCVIYGSAWSYGLVQFYGAKLGPGQTAGTVVVLVVAMSTMAWWWNWLKHSRPRGARYVAWAGCLVLIGGILF
jgi:acyltransferase